MENIPRGKRVVVGENLTGHVCERNRGDEEVMGKYENMEHGRTDGDSWRVARKSGMTCTVQKDLKSKGRAEDRVAEYEEGNRLWVVVKNC